MAGALTFIELDDANSTTIQAQLYNTLPTAGAVTGDRPITAMTVLDDGRMVAGNYYITFSSVVPGVSGILAVNTDDSNNPWKSAAKGVYLDDSQTSSGTGTMINDVVGGLGLYFSNDTDFATSWTSTIVIGGYVSGGGPTSKSSYGILTAGETSAQRKIGVKNTGDADCESCVLGVYPGSYWKNTSGQVPIYKIKVTSKSATAGKYVISCSNYSGVPTPHHIDVYVARYSYNYTTNAWDLAVANTFKGTFDCDSTTAHTTIISGVDVLLSSLISGDCTANIYIEDQSGAQIAPDVAGSPGSWTSGSDITLTETGGGTPGLIQDGNTAYFWLRIVSSVSDSPGNLRKFTLRPTGQSLGSLVE